MGITNVLSEIVEYRDLAEAGARNRFYAVDRRELVMEQGKGMRSEQLP